MDLTKFLIVLVLLAAGTCRANILRESLRSNESTRALVEDLVYIVTTCYGDKIDGVGLAGNLPDTLIKTLSVQHLIPVGLIDTPYVSNEPPNDVPVQFRRKLSLFIIEASSNRQLNIIIQKNMRFTIWWNHMASFIILDMSANCRNGWNFMYIPWQRNVINAKVLCYRGGKRIILNFNPFTGQRPISWRRIGVFPAIKKHPFTVLSRNYRRNKTICEDLDFDKTQNLGGYEIPVGGIRIKRKLTESNRGTYQFVSRVDRLFTTLGDNLNATLKHSGRTDDFVQSDEYIKRHSQWILNSWSSRKTTYPHEETGYIIVSQFRGHKSQLSKILSVIDENSRYGMIIVYLISFMFFKFFARQATVPAFLNLVRITCNTGFANLPGNIAPRIYLGCLLFFAVTMQGIYQSSLASLLTTVVPLPDINTVQDIADFDSETCVVHPLIIKRFNLKKHVAYKDDLKACIMKVKHDPSVVFLGFAQGTVFDEARNFKLHISRELIRPFYVVYDIHWEWPLEERANRIIQTFVEANLFDEWDLQCRPIKLSDFAFDDAVKNNQVFKILELGELSFAFTILGIGLTIATLTLIIELATQYKCVWRCVCCVSVVRR